MFHTISIVSLDYLSSFELLVKVLKLPICKDANDVIPILFYYELQACRRCICMEKSDERMGKQERKVVTMSSDLGEVCEFLLQLMSSESHLDVYIGGYHARTNRLMEETDLVLRFLEEMEKFESTCCN